MGSQKATGQVPTLLLPNISLPKVNISLKWVVSFFSALHDSDEGEVETPEVQQVLILRPQQTSEIIPSLTSIAIYTALRLQNDFNL